MELVVEISHQKGAPSWAAENPSHATLSILGFRNELEETPRPVSELETAEFETILRSTIRSKSFSGFTQIPGQANCKVVALQPELPEVYRKITERVLTEIFKIQRFL